MKIISIFSLLIGFSVTGYAQVPAGIKMYDMGTTASSVQSGFTRVTTTMTYSAGAGFGWTTTSGYSGSGLDVPSYSNFPDPIACDWIGWYRAYSQTCRFRVDVANGDYIVLLMFRNPVPIRDYSVRCSFNSGSSYTTLFSSSISLSNAYTQSHFFLGKGLDYTPGQNAFDKYIDLYYPIRRYDVTVTNSNLLLEFVNCAVSMIVVYPKSQEAAGNTWQAELKTSRKATFNGSYYAEYLPSDSTAVPSDEGKGYRLFTRKYIYEAYPNTKPKSYELILATSVITLSAAKGEFEPVTLGVYPLSDLNNVSVTVSDLTGAGGTIPAANVEVRNAHYIEKRIEVSDIWQKNYTPVPYALMQDAAVNIPNGLTKQFWITVKVPDNAVAGDYTGTVNFAPSNKTATSVPITVTVRNFSLPTPNQCGHTFGWMQAGMESRSENLRLLFSIELAEPVKTQAKNKLKSILEKEMQSMKDHGYNAIQIPTPELSGTSVDYTILNIYAEVMASKNFGLDPAHPNLIFAKTIASRLISNGYTEFSTSFNTTFKNIVTSLRDWANTNNIPLVFWVVDEPRQSPTSDCQANYADTIQYLNLVNSVSNVRTTITMLRDSDGGVNYIPMVDYMSIVQVLPSSLGSGVVAHAQTDNKPLWFYNMGKNVNRYEWGFWNWSTSAVGAWQWNYHFWVTPYFPFEYMTGSDWGEYGVVLPSEDDNPVPTTWYEWAREGIDDYRYAYKLETLISSAVAMGYSSNSDVTAAVALLASIKSSMLTYPTEAICEGVLSRAYSGSEFDNLDLYRENIALSILALQTIVGTPGDSTPPNAPSNLVCMARTTSSIRLSWTASTQAGDGDYASGYRIYRNSVYISTAGGTAYTNTGLSAGTTYSYTVYAVDDAGNQSAASASGNFYTSITADVTAPNPPTSLISTGQTETSITLSWTASGQAVDGDYAAYYRVYRESTLIGTPSGTTMPDAGLSTNTTYNYTIYAVDDSGNQSTAGLQGSFSTLSVGGDTTPPEIESASASNKNAVRITFNEPVEEVSAETVSCYSLDNSITATSAVLDVDLETVILTTNDLSLGTTYTITVNSVRDRATSPNTIISDSQISFVYNGTITPLEKVQALKSADNPADTGGKVVVSWAVSTDADLAGYKVYFGSEPFSSINGATYFSGSPVNNRDASSCTVTGLAVNSQPYYFGVLAVDSFGNVSSETGCTGPVRAINNRIGELVNGIENYEIAAGFNTSIKVLVPPGTNKGVFIDILTVEGTSSVLSEATLSQVSQANSKASVSSKIISTTVNSLSSTCTEFKAKLSLLSEVTIVIPYPANITGETEDSLRIYTLNEITNEWDLVSAHQDLDKVNNTVSVSVPHFSIFRILGTVLSSDNLTSVRVYPNPFKPNDAKAGTGDWSTGIIFDGLTNNSTIKIYTMSGEHIVTLNETDNNGKYEWNVKDKSGNRVASGTYIYRITNSNGEKLTGKIGVIR
ncbi:MAG: hypothetical protein A2252_00355 [Elusimicrobia bacterium RIFOXYA2_FULL_39_19]|nr:MAG: hypothetical protein A2252_00355 [Elusimicrobia bacterium RIFOXYA2_FULL_39_19]